MHQLSDTEFLARLTVYLKQFSEGAEPPVPIFRNGDGSLNRERMLALPCFAGFRLEEAWPAGGTEQ